MDFAAGEDQQQQPISHILSHPIILSDQILHTINDSKSYKLECIDLKKLIHHLSQMLRSFVRLTTATPSFYDRPVRRIFSDITTTLTRTLTLLRKCRRRTIFLRLLTIVTTADFKKLSTLLDASIGDMKWLLSLYDARTIDNNTSGVVLSLPPIASNDPVIAWVWSYITSLYLTPLNFKIEVANELCSLATSNDRTKKMIVEEGGILPLLKLLKEDILEAQIAAATTLFHLANDQVRARMITSEVGVPIIVQCLHKSSIRVQIEVSKLIGRMAENDEVSQEAFARENVIRPLVTLLSFDTVEDQYEKRSIDSVFKMSTASSATTMWSIKRNERENESSELKLELKVSCARALWMLARGNLANCKILTDTKGLLTLTKLIETETGELQTNCLMNVMEIAAAAESNNDLRRAAFRTNSPAAKAVVDQLLRLIHECEIAGIKIPAIRSIGSLARTFPARETRVIGPLVKQLSHQHQHPDVVLESVIALGKFASPDNYLCKEHSKTIIEFDGVIPLMRLLRGNDRTQHDALVLLCYLAMHAGNNEALMQARVLTALEGADKSIVGQHSQLRQLVVEAIHQLNMYHAGVVISSQKLSFSP
ncbi:hypothetical protein QVD17_21255 [Tagetes erecta]|uniref:DUF7792 domain-containing protein n=1 Tax=Tagetes erecta TaxID=13708 RepID=A0AAD8KN69_TARER|nr:hypothetical protein QVD17_21255 [Tagetes erecta]